MEVECSGILRGGCEVDRTQLQLEPGAQHRSECHQWRAVLLLVAQSRKHKVLMVFNLS